MNEVAEALEEARAELSGAAYDFLPDLMVVYGPGAEVKDSFGEVTTPDAIIEVEGEQASDIPCEVQELSAYEKLAGGSIASGSTNKIKVVVNRFTLAIQAHHKLVVAAQGEVPERTFEVTGRPLSSTSLFMYLPVVEKS